MINDISDVLFNKIGFLTYSSFVSVERTIFKATIKFHRGSVLYSETKGRNNVGQLLSSAGAYSRRYVWEIWGYDHRILLLLQEGHFVYCKGLWMKWREPHLAVAAPNKNKMTHLHEQCISSIRLYKKGLECGYSAGFTWPNCWYLKLLIN